MVQFSSSLSFVLVFEGQQLSKKGRPLHILGIYFINFFSMQLTREIFSNWWTLILLCANYRTSTPVLAILAWLNANSYVCPSFYGRFWDARSFFILFLWLLMFFRCLFYLLLRNLWTFYLFCSLYNAFIWYLDTLWFIQTIL